MRDKSANHLDYIRQLPCVICGDNTCTEAAHVRYGDARVAKPLTGIGIKPDDCWTVPLCSEHHRDQHKRGEYRWWKGLRIDPVFLALALWRASGDIEDGEAIIRHVHL